MLYRPSQNSLNCLEKSIISFLIYSLILEINKPVFVLYPSIFPSISWKWILFGKFNIYWKLITKISSFTEIIEAFKYCLSFK